MSQEVISQLEQNINTLKIRVFDAEEKFSNLSQNIQVFLNESAKVMDKESTTLQEIYDILVKHFEPVEKVEPNKEVKQTKTKKTTDE